MKTQLAGNLASSLFATKKKLGNIATDQKWQNIREGLKLRSVINSKRMNEVSTCVGDIDMEGSFLSRKLFINRHLGMKHVMPKSGQWVVHSDKKDECWRCNQHILSLFLWTPRIGALSCDKDDEKTKYYKHEMDKTRDMDPDLPSNMTCVPHVASTFNEWMYKPMNEVIKFCMQKDLMQPDFVEECTQDGLIRPENGRLTEDEKSIVNNVKEAYYKDNWQTVLMSMFRFKKPMVANAQSLTSESLKVDPASPIYVYVDWLKPGRHTYVV